MSTTPTASHAAPGLPTTPATPATPVAPVAPAKPAPAPTASAADALPHADIVASVAAAFPALKFDHRQGQRGVEVAVTGPTPPYTLTVPTGPLTPDDHIARELSRAVARLTGNVEVTALAASADPGVRDAIRAAAAATK